MLIEKYYQKNIGNYTMNATRKRNILALIPEDAVNILDIGCGQGELAEVLQKDNKHISGVDISSQALDMAGDYLDEKFCFNVEDEFWPEELLVKNFDCIIASEVVEHLFEPSNFLKKIKQVLQPQGVLVLTTPNFLFWKNRLKMLFGKFEYEESGFYDKGHISFFTRSSLKKTDRKSVV